MLKNIIGGVGIFLCLAGLVMVFGTIFIDNSNLRYELETARMQCTSTKIGDIAAVMIVDGFLVCTHTGYVPLKQTLEKYSKRQHQSVDRQVRPYPDIKKL